MSTIDQQESTSQYDGSISYISLFDGKYSSIDPSTSYGYCRLVSDFEKLNRLGEGTYGVVYRARDKTNDRIVALKKMRVDERTEGISVSSFREINLLLRINHPNIVMLHEVAVGKNANNMFLVMEFCEQDLAILLDHMKMPFSEAQIKCITLQLARALDYMHKRNIIHRDIKVSNLLLTNEGVIKLADFGLARQIGEPPGNLTPEVVTLWYRPPELLFGGKEQTAAIDMWACGCILGELLLHQPLLPGRSDIDQISLIINLLGSPNEAIWPEMKQMPMLQKFQLKPQPYNNIRQRFKFLNDDGVSLLNELFMYDPKRRISAQYLLDHTYFTQHPYPCEPSLMPSFPQHRNK